MPRRLRTLRGLLLVAIFAAAAPTSASGTTIGHGDGLQEYIVYLGNLPSTDDASSESDEAAFSAAVEAAHHDLLNQVLDSGSSASDRIIRSYKRSLNGFAAKLTQQEAQKLSSMDDSIVSIFPSRTHELQTTRSWDFLDLPRAPQQELPLQGEVIVGMLDTGVWPDSPSFSDQGFLPPPKRWKGTCHNITCNRKIIGARAYRGGSAAGQSPLDDEGHGSHTASTAAGRAVGDVSFGGLAAGTARGAAPGARLAVYKVCWGRRCGDADILAAFDDAVADGVDVVSVSIAFGSPRPYWEDSIAIGAFHAMARGVVTSAAAGNGGARGGRVANVAPWMLSVAASTIDRRFVSKILLGNGATVVGASINTFPKLENVALALPADGSCDPRNLTEGSYMGKIVLCPLQHGAQSNGSGPLLAGAAGVVIASDEPDEAVTLPLPGLTVTQGQFDQIMAYVNSTSNPVGSIGSTETTTDRQAPKPASFSSPGPNLITPGILKPDLSAPGIDIIASWSLLSSPSGIANDTRRALYKIDSGTSMACPHATGAAAYVKSFHRDWSPAMIMSALITTATPMNTPGNSGYDALKYGAGQLNPVKAKDPGLVYDASEGDYVAMLCAQGYNATQLALVTGSSASVAGSSACGAAAAAGSPSSGSDLNYPTMAASVQAGKSFAVGFPRTVTNVGAASIAVYHVKVVLDNPVEEKAAAAAAGKEGLAVDVSPRKLVFSAHQKQKMSFTVTVSGVAPPEEGQVRSAAVVWCNEEHEVWSPVVVYTV